MISIICSACGSGAPTPVPTPSALPSPTTIPTPVAGTLCVDPSVDLGPISPLVYGSNYGPWLAVSLAMLPAVRDSGVTILRFPAGSWGDNNDVKTYQIDQFMSFIKDMDAGAMINVRLKNGTPQQAAEMVRYVNIEKKYNVSYWGIGNEPGLYAREMNEVYDSERFNREWRAIAEAMLAVDPEIQLVGPEFHQFSFDTVHSTNYSEDTARDSAGRLWMDEFLKANGDLVDVVSFHRYPFPLGPTSGPPSADELRQNAREWDSIIIRLRGLIHETTGRDLPIAVTEFNSAYNKSVGGDTTPDSHYNAIWLADVLGRLIRNGVFMSNQWMLTSKGGFGGWGLVGPSEPHPSFYVYQLYRKFGDQLVYASSDDLDLSIYAARAADDSLTIIVINLSFDQKTKPLRIEGVDGARAEAWMLDPTHHAENMGSVDLSAVLTIPPESMTLYILPAEHP
ncbi:MAG TPA: hypothetical protein VGJ22_10375 [Anaerolineales bacterium]